MNFHRTIQPVLFTFQLFGLVPLQGILSHEPTRWRFRWCSPQTLLCLLLVVVGILLCYVDYSRLTVIGVNADNLIGPLFYLDVIVIMVLLLRVAHRWPTAFVGKFQEVENLLHSQRHREQTRWKIRSVAMFLLFSGFAEHMLAVGKAMHARIAEARICHWSYESFPEYYALRSYSFIFRRIPYNFAVLLFLEYANTALTLAWTAEDVLIVMLTDALANYLDLINDRIEQYGTAQQVVTAKAKFWSDIHLQYVAVCELLEQVMATVSPLLVVSCASNLYLICYQLFHILETQKYFIDTVFAYFSLFCVITRTFLTMNYCSAVYERARHPLKLCRRIPSANWCSEVQRFNDFIRKHTIVISAMGLFNLTRRTMLGMLGAVITYELVMLHFAQTTASQGIVRVCSSEEDPSDDPSMESATSPWDHGVPQST